MNFLEGSKSHLAKDLRVFVGLIELKMPKKVAGCKKTEG